jgi:hypothetical protein
VYGNSTRAMSDISIISIGRKTMRVTCKARHDPKLQTSQQTG